MTDNYIIGVGGYYMPRESFRYLRKIERMIEKITPPTSIHLLDHIIIPINVLHSHWFPAHINLRRQSFSFLDSYQHYSAASYPQQELLTWKFLKMTWTTHVKGANPGPQWVIPPDKFIKLHPGLTGLTPTTTQMPQKTEMINVQPKREWIRRGIRSERIEPQSADQPESKWTMLEQTGTPQQNNFTNNTETRLACGIYTVLSALYAVRNWEMDFLQQIHIRQARNWMVAIGLATTSVVTLYRCNCGRQHEQWQDQPTPSCPDCTTGPSKTSNKKRASGEVVDSGKRTKHETRGIIGSNELPQGTLPNPLFEVTPKPINHTPGVASTTSSPVLTSRPETVTRRELTLKEKVKPKPQQETAGNVATNTPLRILGRGICNTGNTCFLNATIQCLGAIDELHQAGLSIQTPPTTHDDLLECLRKLRQSGVAYNPAALVKRIPHLIRHIPGDPGDAHELLIALINEVNTPLAQIFQGQMSSTVQCSHCKKLTITIDIMQDISLHICTDTSSPLLERLLKLFQPEILDGENAFWCGDCQESHPATKTLACTNIPTILIIHLKRLLPGGTIHNHIPFETTLDMEPFMTPELMSAQKMELIGIISHQGTGKNGHYVAATKKGTEWILYDDSITTQLTLTQLHRLQAYVLIYRKTSPNTELGATPGADTSEKSEKVVPANEDHKCLMKPLLPPDPSDEPHIEQKQYPATRAVKPSHTATERPRENPMMSNMIVGALVTWAINTQGQLLL